MTRQGIGVDFGTTNSALAKATADGTTVGQFSLFGEATRVFRSVLFFEAERELVAFKPPAWVGPEAIEQYIETGADGRLMQSMKSFLGSKHLRGTSVFGRDVSLEALVATVIRDLWAKGCTGLGFSTTDRPPIVAGRPVEFAYADNEEGNRFAQDRLKRSFEIAGFKDVEFVMEPVAAAFHYEDGLDHDEVVLVADFGGGTTDFCLLRVGPSSIGRPDDERIIGTAGVPVAGDNFDARIVEHLVAPALGKGVQYRSQLGKMMDLPAWMFSRLQRWNELSILKSQKNMQSLERYARSATEPEKIRALIEVVDEDLGYSLFQSVERTKVELSGSTSANFEFKTSSVDIQQRVERADFERWIGNELRQMEAGLDKLLASSGMDPSEINTVFLTGGTALVPAVRQVFTSRFGPDRVRTGD
ncbi:MAG: putative chaperone protein, partial [Myxococcota bacterium]